MLRNRVVLVLLSALILAACAQAGAPAPQPTEIPAATKPAVTASSPIPLPTTLPASKPPTATPTPAPDEPVSATPGTPGAASGGTAVNPFAPQPSDAKWTRGNVFLDGADILVLESAPPQIVLALTGSRPTPCHQLRVVVSPPDAQNQIQVEVYTVVDPDMMCIQVLTAFAERVPLGTFPAGQYTVSVNGAPAGAFSS